MPSARCSSSRAGASSFIQVTPHERRTRELEALRRLIADCEAQIASPGDISTAVVAAAFEQHTSLLPDESQLRAPLQGLAQKLRQSPSPVIAESRLRNVVASLRPKADDLGRWVEGRDAKLKSRR